MTLVACVVQKNHYKLCKCHWNGCCRKEQKFFHHASSPKKVSKKSENMACKKSFGSFWTSESHNLSHLFPFSLYYSSSHLQIMKAIMLLLRQTPFYDYEFLVRLGTKYSLHLCMQKRPHKIWANAFNKLSQDNAWKVPQTKILCTKSGFLLEGSNQICQKIWGNWSASRHNVVVCSLFRRFY